MAIVQMVDDLLLSKISIFTLFQMHPKHIANAKVIKIIPVVIICDLFGDIANKPKKSLELPLLNSPTPHIPSPDISNLDTLAVPPPFI